MKACLPHRIYLHTTNVPLAAPLNARQSSLYFLKLSETLPMQQDRMNVGACRAAYFIQADARINATRNTGRNIQQYVFV